ncbi:MULTISPECIES: hypothetical protein [unclassified Flavobacterium]|uniref:hypothetical protein n=1 Tax=unclassified Flavobacterium TaxID=196869 RepID=UPI00131D0809|nr:MULTISPECIES: hypothetical protein [unclassified Flavobacterium]
MFQYTSISVSVKDSVGKCNVSFTIPLLLSSSAFFARILASENAETFGSPVFETGVAATGVGITLVGCCIVVSAGIPGLLSVAELEVTAVSIFFATLME